MPSKMYPGREKCGRPRRPRASPHGITWAETRQKVFARDGHLCHLCGHPGANEVDHLVPTDDPTAYYDLGNLAPAHGGTCPCPYGCGACNARKGRRIPRPRDPARPKLSRDW